MPRGRADLDEVLNKRSLLAVVAHPDDESFGLGAVLAAFGRHGAETALLCFTHGEASTLHGVEGDLHVVRARELADAARVLGVKDVRLLDYEDGSLAAIGLEILRDDVAAMIEDTNPDLLLVFDEGGITGHRDHARATEAALGAAHIAQLPVVAWALPANVAAVLNAEFGTTFCGRTRSELDYLLPIERVTQQRAIACHASQAKDNAVLWRRLELLSAGEWLRKIGAHGA